MASRPPIRVRIARAEEIINNNPFIGKRGLQSQLRKEYGVGIRDATARLLIRKADAPTVLLQRVNSPAFSASERKILRDYIRKGNPPYIKDVIYYRWDIYKYAIGKNWSKPQYRNYIKKEAKKSDWLVKTTTRSKANPKGRVKGQIDLFKMIKDFRKDRIEEGSYIPIVKSHHGVKKDQIAQEKKRWEERQDRNKREAEIAKKQQEWLESFRWGDE